MADCTQVFLGLPDQSIEEEDSTLCNWSTNKLGGRPDWMERVVEESPSCKLCKRQLLLVSQVYCPLSGSPYHRTLYIFGCVSPACWNQSRSWTVLRSQQMEEARDVSQADKLQNPVKYSSVDDWGEDTGDWGDADEWNDHAVTELECATSKLSLNHQVDPVNSKIPIPLNNVSSTKPLISHPRNQETPCFQPYYINVFETFRTTEETDQTSLTKREKELLLSYQEREGISINDIISLPNQSNTKQQGHVTEGYEKTAVAHGDKGFHKFQKYLQQCPQQCIRYEWNGTLLSISSSHTPSDIMSTVPRCQYCGSHRVYELQLMPALVTLLRMKESPDKPITTLKNENENIAENETVNGTKDSNEKLEALPGDTPRTRQGIEFGTAIVFSCGKSCWEDNDGSCFFREEFLVVQADPDAELFKNKI